MSIDIPLELDTGPITWVKPEIEASLARVLSGIAASRERIEPEVKKSIARELHTVAGAFELVGVEGLAVLVREFELHFSAPSEPPSVQALEQIERGVRRLLAHVQEIAAGAPAVPIRFLPEYLALGKLRNVRLGPADLFFPDLSRKPARAPTTAEIPPGQLPALLMRKRREFQQGLLVWLRGGGEGLALMGNALASIEEAFPLPAQRSFWWSTRALIRAVEARLLEPSVALKQLLARVDLQIRRFAEGSTRVADRLRREVLYHLARSEDGDPLVDEVKGLYELGVLIPKRVPIEIDYVAIQPVLERLGQAVARAKERWGASLGAARERDRDEFVAAVDEIAAQSKLLGHADFKRLGEALAETVHGLGGATPSDDVSIEIASTLILIETAASQIASLPRNFPAQVDTTIQRLTYARKGIAIPTELRSDADADSLTRKAQERATIAQVVREIRTNMRAVEQALDAAFRDRSAVDELAPVPGLLAQVSGALQILGWTRANDILSETSSRLLQGIQSEQPLDDRLINEYADTLAGISFYIDAKEQRESEAEAMLDALERRARGEPVGSGGVPEDQSVEASIAGHRRQLRESLELAAEPSGADSAREAVLAIKHDAELLADTRLLGAANSALAAIDQGKPDAAAVSELLAASDAIVPVPEASPESQRLARAQDDERDSLLLEIFCEEAVEVVATLKQGVSNLVSAPGDRHALVTVRRAFHTLKGSGRMVGLADFGEAAWQIERVLNGVIESDRAPLPHEVALMNAATTLFDGWVSDLKDTGRADVDVGAITRLVAACERRELALDGGAASAIQDAAAAPTTVLSDAVAVEAPGMRAPEADAPPHGLPPLAFAPIAEPPLPTSPSAPTVAPLPTLDFAPTSEAAPSPPVVPEPASVSPAVAEQVEAPATAEELADEPIVIPEVIELPASAWSLEDENVVVEGVTVPRTLFSILVDESRAHLQTLEQELALLQFDAAGVPSDSMVRAAHTLCGIHRTAGFTNIGDLAAETESALVALSGAARDGEAYAVIASAIAALRTASLRIQTQTSMREEEHRAFGQALVAMRGLNARLGARTRDAVAAAMAATRDDATPAPDTLVPTAGTVDEQATEAPAAPPPVERASALVGLAPPAPTITVSPLDANVAAPIASPSAESTPAPASATSALELPGEARKEHPAVSPALEPVAVSAEPPASSVSATHAPAPVAAERVATPAAQPAATTPGSAAASPAPTVSAAVAPLGIAAATSAGAAAPVPTVPPRAEADPVDPLADVRDEVDEQVMPLFLEEAQELFPAATEQARMMRAAPADAAARSAIKRTLHTLKGSARMAGAMRLGEITHMLETRIIEAPAMPGSEFFDAVDEALDDVAFLLDRHSRGQHNVVLPRYRPDAVTDTAGDVPGAPSGEEPSTTKAADALAAVVEQKPAPSLVAVQAAAPVVPVAVAASASAAAVASAGTAIAPTAATAEAAFLRVRSDALETLADEAGEIAIARARIESELRDLKTGLLDLTSAVIRLRSQLREIEIQGESQIQSRLDTESTFDPLEFDRYTRFQELTRGLAEGVNDVATVQQNLLKNLADADASLAAQMRLSRSVQLRLQSMRTVPFATLSDRLYRVLRQTAKELGKRANLDIRGGRIEIDRSVLERLAPVLEHLVRNALAHGIETAAERERVGKSATGEMGLAVSQQGNEVVIELTDDGAGLPLAKIEARARALGMLAPDAQVSEAELVELIFQTGFSTAETVSAIAGRGVGMDVVRSEITALGGRVEVRTQAGRGTSFVLRVPLTLAVTQVLLVRTGDTAVGIPASLIETVRQVRTTECDAARASGSLLHLGKPIPYFVLSPLYDKTPPDATDHRTRSVAILRSGDLVAAFELEAVIGNQEVVAKPYGPQLARVRGLAGLTVLGDGSIVILSNPLQLMPSVILPEQARTARLASVAAQDEVPSGAAMPADAPAAAAAVGVAASMAASAALAPVAAEVIPIRPDIAVQPRTPLVLVVDDSLTVRKITTRLLEREGYRVLTAKDGLDALQVLADHTPNVILLDIEMPRMDGFEFARTIRSDDRQRGIPIIMITSRTADKHRMHAKELGVEEYLGKPYQDDQLLGLLAQYTGGVQ